MPRVAYFSPEFGVSEEIPQYSGGLGVLAGDYLRVCADEDKPLMGVGLFYHLGYFRQHLSGDGWQQESYRELAASELGMEPVGERPIKLPLGERILNARVWRQMVGSVPLYLLDTVCAENDDDLRFVTDRLYGGDTEHRLRQEILLGMGGSERCHWLGRGRCSSTAMRATLGSWPWSGSANWWKTTGSTSRRRWRRPAPPRSSPPTPPSQRGSTDSQRR